MSHYYKNLSSDVKSTSFEIIEHREKVSKLSEFNHTEHLKKPTSKYEVEKVPEPLNSFVQSAFYAYSQHHKLVIRPDDVWIAIMTQFSFYLNANSEQLREKLVDFQGKKDLEVVANATLFNAPYDEMTLAMTDLISRNIKDPSIRDWSMPSFSTTTYNDRIVGAVCLMATMKKYYNFKYSLRCGLSAVTMLGSVEDWKSLKDKAQRLVEFDVGEQKLMSKWSAMLLPILDQFIRSVSGESVNDDGYLDEDLLDWWNRIANHIGGGSGPTWLSGWITVFTVFSPEGKWYGDYKHAVSIRVNEKSEWPFVETQDVATGFVELDVIIDDNGTEYASKLYGGHYSVKVFDDEQTLVPQLNWCISVKEQDIKHLQKN
ncbi:hypothetical protein PPL_08783 [Heterostelium album PN500]|uniref:Uncharacterized protein n=1 Tax=Heterostelium pallidum (strain ATCC 26659 / Pp 5 / PN500) TaxID=670386 RepID=D3BJQ4_HETP5|nr:hypothetical protein PPL_08783 [Heterostelium album PN500]EFA78134.1 hypothetical protein PPL_08783 [Heterostelium album PN500]|eukprot:XP_020430260.1 hypothetical protein PPL_08783 [Heterostelium album PN500]